MRCQARNEKILKALADNCSQGVLGTIDAAIADLSIPRVKAYRPYSTFKGQFSLGDSKTYPESAFRIDVDRYFRIKDGQAPEAVGTSYGRPLQSEVQSGWN